MITVTDYKAGRTLEQEGDRGRDYCEQLERGEILFFGTTPFELAKGDRAFLLGQELGNARIHKNISYRPASDSLRGASGSSAEERASLHRIMRDYSRSVTQFVYSFFGPYHDRLLLDYASYRPVEEAGRAATLHKRNDLLHVDAFPSRPTHGGRILRVFTNINPSEARVWLVSEDFENLARNRARDAGLDRVSDFASSSFGRFLKRGSSLMKAAGLPVKNRSAYDRFMLRFHDYMKENEDFQKNCCKRQLEFPPGSTWLVCTDIVPHAVLSGRFALEQTYIVPRDVQVAPDQAPISHLEKLAGCRLSST